MTMVELFPLTWQLVLFCIITLGWWAEFILFPSRLAVSSGEGRKSFFIIFASILIVLFVSVGLGLLGLGNAPDYLRYSLRVFALFFYGLGLSLRYYSLLYLGQHFTRGVQVHSEQELVSSGPYRWIRHPLYLALFLLIIGAVLFVTNIPGVIVAFLGSWLFLRKRIENEEQEMEEVLGTAYLRWKEERYRLIPFIY